MPESVSTATSGSGTYEFPGHLSSHGMEIEDRTGKHASLQRVWLVKFCIWGSMVITPISSLFPQCNYPMSKDKTLYHISLLFSSSQSFYTTISVICDRLSSCYSTLKMNMNPLLITYFLRQITTLMLVARLLKVTLVAWHFLYLLSAGSYQNHFAQATVKHQMVFS